MLIFTQAACSIGMIIFMRTQRKMSQDADIRRLPWICAAVLLALGCLGPGVGGADTVASLLGNFTINQYCGLALTSDTAYVHYVVIFGQLPALRELHLADTNGDGVTSQAERDAYVASQAAGFADRLLLRVDGVPVQLRATHWTSSLPTEQGGFSLREDVDFAAALPSVAKGERHELQFANQNFADRLGWHEISVRSAPALAVFDTNAYSTSLTGGLTEALQTLPSAGPLDERSVHLGFAAGSAPAGSVPLAARPGAGTQAVPATARASGKGSAGATDSAWIARETRRLVNAISGPRLEPHIALLALLGAVLLGAVHALSPGHGKTIVGAYLIGSRGTPRHALFLGSTVTITHTLGVFVLGFATLYASRFIVPERLFPILSLTSALLVLGMGIALLVQRARAARQILRGSTMAATVFYPVAAAAEPGLGRGLVFAGAHSHSHADGTLHSHGGGAMHSHLPPGAAGEKVTWRNLLTLGISGGLVPCPSAMVLLLAAVALNKTAYGMVLVLAFSLGLAITLTAVGMAFLYARNRFRKPRPGARWPHLLPVLSAITITVLGMGLCFAALKSL
jgi:nickel/cobalt transporter (NicO) family protein